MIYYRVVTFTTLGFGDITPKNPQAAYWVMAEVVNIRTALSVPLRISSYLSIWLSITLDFSCKPVMVLPTSSRVSDSFRQRGNIFSSRA